MLLLLEISIIKEPVKLASKDSFKIDKREGLSMLVKIHYPKDLPQVVQFLKLIQQDRMEYLNLMNQEEVQILFTNIYFNSSRIKIKQFIQLKHMHWHIMLINIKKLKIKMGLNKKVNISFVQKVVLQRILTITLSEKESVKELMQL